MNISKERGSEKRERLKSCLRYKLQNSLLIAWSTACFLRPSDLLSMPLPGLTWTGKATLASLPLITQMLTVTLEMIKHRAYTALHNDRRSSQTVLTQPSVQSDCSWKMLSACIIISSWKEDRPWKTSLQYIPYAVKAMSILLGSGFIEINPARRQRKVLHFVKETLTLPASAPGITDCGQAKQLVNRREEGRTVSPQDAAFHSSCSTCKA